jgi:hypothetical protein
MKIHRSFFRFLLLGISLLLASPLAAQVPAGSLPPSKEQTDKQAHGLTLYESFDGSSSADGQVINFTSRAGYIFNKHFAVDLGLPIYFVRGTTATGAKTSSSGIGDAFGDLRLAFDDPLVNYGTSLTLSAPSGQASQGRSTGHMTYDWSNTLSHDFGRLSPFVDLGVGNSLYDTRFFHRPFLTYGKLAHFEGGASFDLGFALSLTASLYDVAPWGQQTVYSRIVTPASPPAAAGGHASHGRVFESAAQTTGTADLVRDNGYSAGLDFNPVRALDFGVAYSRSVHYQLNTVSFHVGVNLTSVLHRTRP